MELKNIEKAKELLPIMETLIDARSTLGDSECKVWLCKGGHEVVLPSSLRMNILNVVNCEYERVRKEVIEL